MAPWTTPRIVFVLAVVAALAAPVLAAQTTAPCDPKTAQSANCSAQPAAPSAHDQFPFPGETAGADDPLSKPATAAPVKPNAPGSFPYPGDPDPAASTSGSSSSNSSSSSSSDADPDLPPDTPPSDTPGRRKLPKVTKLQTDDEREAEDVKVAKFYHDDGNELGSYNRLKDAVSLIHDDADAWFLMGQVAAKLHRTAESANAFQKFLALEPDTRRARQARRELAALPAFVTDAPVPSPTPPPAAGLPRPQ